MKKGFKTNQKPLAELKADCDAAAVELKRLQTELATRQAALREANERLKDPSLEAELVDNLTTARDRQGLVIDAIAALVVTAERKAYLAKEDFKSCGLGIRNIQAFIARETVDKRLLELRRFSLVADLSVIDRLLSVHSQAIDAASAELARLTGETVAG